MAKGSGTTRYYRPTKKAANDWEYKQQRALEGKAAYVYRFDHPKITRRDYYIATNATFQIISIHPQSDEARIMSTDELDAKTNKMWNDMKASGKYTYHHSPLSSSEYLIAKNGDIYRKSDHWGRVASCYWDLDKHINGGANGHLIIAKCNIKDFKTKNTPKWEIDTYRDELAKANKKK